MITPDQPRRISKRGSGDTLNFSADPITKTRLAYCKHTLSTVLGLNTSNTVLIRRALEVYAEQLTSVIDAQELAATVPSGKLPAEGTSRKALKAVLVHANERSALKRAAQGDARTLTDEQIQSVPIRPLRQLLTNDVVRPGMMDLIRADLRRWAKQPNSTEKESDDF